MSLHDAYARTTPFELAFPDAGEVDRLIAELEEEARGRGADPGDPGSFVTMGSVGSFIQRLQGPEAPPEAIHQYAALVYQAAYFRDAGCPLWILGAHAARYLVEGAPGGVPEPPASSGYLQLPQHLFWVSAPGEGAAPESIDGFFWTVSPGGLLHVLAAVGVRPDRPGFGTVPVPEAPIADAAAWLDFDARPGGDDFRSALPGAELDGLLAVETSGEILKLLARFFAYLHAVPGAAEQGEAPSGAADPPPSELEFRRVALSA